MNNSKQLRKFFTDLGFLVNASTEHSEEIYDYDRRIGIIDEMGLILDYDVLLEVKPFHEKIYSMFGAPDMGTDRVAVWDWDSIDDAFAAL